MQTTKKWPFEFNDGDQVYLNISPMKGVMGFWQEGEVEAEVCWVK